MMRAISIIKSEHRNLGAVLYSLEKLVEELDQGKQADFEIFHGLFTYIDRFLDRYHHPKEDQFLFPRLMERAPDTEKVVKELGLQHVEGEVMFVAMLKALSAYEFLGESEFPPFREALLRYTAFERDHALMEEKEILPRAADALLPDDWAEIDAAFEENQDPLFGSRWRSEFSELMERLVNRLPAPLGLGDVWK